MNKTLTLAILITLLIVLTGLIYLNRDQFRTPLQTEENKSTQTESPSPTDMPEPTPGSVDIDVEIENLDKSLDAVNPDELDGADLDNAAVGL